MPSKPLTSTRNEAAFAEFATANLPLLQAVAYLLVGDVARSEALVRFTLAQLFQRWPTDDDALAVALQRLLAADPARLGAASHQIERFELLDAPTRPAEPAAGIVADLAGLDGDQRRALVLEQFAGLTPDQVAEVLGIDPAEAGRLARQARVRLAAVDPGLMDDALLRQRLSDALPLSLRTAPPYEIAPSHGLDLWWRSWERIGLFVAAVALVSIAAATWIWAGHPTTGARTPPSAPTTSALQPPPCADLDCRTRTVAAWRDEMAAVLSSYLDPRGAYFKGTGFTPEPKYESPGFWTGEGGVLGLDLVPRDSGATFVYLQIATRGEDAVTCGDMTAQGCRSQQFLDGNRFSVTETTTARQGGVEVQYSPAGTEVITIVVVDVGTGRPLAVDRGRLMQVVQDQRLHLPHG